MNWVGGSRTRVLIKQERRKQKEYFEKNRLKSKMKLLGVLSPVKNSAVSLDLLNLYMVNQISCKKEIPETMRKPVHVNMNRDINMPLRKHNLELPMSPHCIPSKLCLDDTEISIHYQRQSNKKEVGPVQPSQLMKSSSVLEPQFNRIENYSLTPPPFSAELSSNRHISQKKFTPIIAPTPWTATCEKKNEQLSNMNSSDSLVSKLNESEDILRQSCKTGPFETSFERLNRPENENFLTKRPAIIMGEDCGSRNERGQSEFITETQSIQHVCEENGNEVSDYLEGVNHLSPSIPSENRDSFVNQDMVNLLNIDQQRMKKTLDKCGYDSMDDFYGVPSSAKNHCTDGYIKSIFIVPELPFSNSSFNKTNYPEKSVQPNMNYQKKYNNNERNDFSTYFEKDCHSTSPEIKGTLDNGYQQKTPQKNIQKYPVNTMGNTPSEELHSRQSWDFGLGEILKENRGMCALKGRPTLTTKIDLDSSQSSESASYSPRPAVSSFSSSSEMLSEDEDQILQQIEDSNRIPIKTKETTDNFYLEKMGKLTGDKTVKRNAIINKHNENFHQFSMKNNTHQLPQTQGNSAHVLQNKTSNNYILQVVKCDTGVQTDSEPLIKEKLDAAVQCDIISESTCRSAVFSLCNIERCSEDIKADTTGGQEILKDD